MEDLCEVMSREVTVMREVLANMHLEQNAILRKDCACLSIIKEDRTALLDSMKNLRSLIIDKIDQLDISEESEFIVLKEQILTLGEKIQSLLHHNRTLEIYPFQPKAVKEKKVKVVLKTLP